MSPAAGAVTGVAWWLISDVYSYTDYLGLSVEGFNLGWVAQYRSRDGDASVHRDE